LTVNFLYFTPNSKVHLYIIELFISLHWLIFVVDNHIKNFLAWQTSMEKGRAEKEARQHCLQVHRIWRQLDKNLSLSTLLEFDRVRDTWLQEARVEWAPGTIRSYLGNIFAIYSGNTN
jgi:hypothetical protein